MADDLRVVVDAEPEPGLLDGFDIGARTGRFTRSTEMRDLPREEAYAEINDELYRLTGKRLPNPMTQDRMRVGGLRNRDLGQNNVGNTERQWLEEMLRVTSPTRSENVGGELKPVDPRVQALITRATPEAIARRSDELMRAAAQEGADYNRAFGIPGMLISGFGDLGGNIAAGDPTAIAGTVGAIGGTAMRTVLGTFGKDAAINGLASAVGEYATAAGARELGQPYTYKDFLLNTTVGATVGGTIGVTGRVGMDIVQGRLGVARPGGRPAPEPEAAPMPDAPDIAAPPEETVSAVAAALRSTESVVQREKVTEAAVARRTSTIEPEEEAFRAIDEADDMVRDVGGEPEPPATVRETTPEEVQSARVIADEAPAPAPGTQQTTTFRGVTRPITFEQFNPSEIGFDPAAFQYKRASGEQGQTGTLEGVATFDPVSSGKVLVFERKDGARFIADGHQRLALARRAQESGQSVSLDGYLYREADGFTPQDVRQIAAQKNLREGAGDPLDVAAILREAPDLLDSSMPLSGAVMRTGRALARLTDETLGAVRNGLVTPEQGAIIARVLGDHPELQMPAVKQFMEDPPRNEAEATFIAREMQALPAHREAAAQMGLFGDAPLISGARERGAILAAAQAAIRNDKRAFSAAERFAADLEEAGNVLAKESNARRAEAATVMLNELMTLATRAGPVSDALRRITTDAIANKTSAKAAGQQFADEVLDMLNERGFLALKTGAPVTPPPVAPDVKAPLFHETLPLEVRAQEISRAQDMDFDAEQGALAEAAVERAMRGDAPPVFEEDALGITPESDLAAIDRALAAMEALGEPIDPTVREAAAAFLASPDEALYQAARGSLAPTFSKRATPDAPRTHTAATEADMDVEAPFQPLRFKDEYLLLEDLKWVTMPELAAIARDFDVQSTGSRAEITAAILKDWRQAQPDPEPVAPPPPPPAAEISDLTKRAIRFHGRDDAKLRSDDAIADLVASVRNMPNADSWLAREIEDSADDRRTAVLRQVRETLKNEPRFARRETLEAVGKLRREIEGEEIYFASVADNVDRLSETVARLTEMADLLRENDNAVPASIIEPIVSVQKAIGDMDALVDLEPAEVTIAAADKVLAMDGGRLPPELRDAIESLREGHVQLRTDRPTIRDGLRADEGADDGLLEDVEIQWRALPKEWEEANPDLATAVQDLVNESVDTSYVNDPAGAFDEARPVLARIRRNLDELWDEWQGGYGKRVDEELARKIADRSAGWERAEAVRAFTDDALDDVLAAFDNGVDESPSLRAFSRPKSVRMAEAPRGWTDVDTTITYAGSTPEVLTRAIEKRFGKKVTAALIEKGKLTIVAKGEDLPIFKDGGKFAMAAAKTDVDAMISRKEMTVRALTNIIDMKPAKPAEAGAIIYTARLDGHTLRINLDRRGDGTLNVAMAYDGKMSSPAGGMTREDRIAARDAGRTVGASLRQAADVFGLTIAVLRHAIAKQGVNPVVTFAGGDTGLHAFYAKMLTLRGFLPDGYKAFVRIPDGTFYLMPDGADPAIYGKSMIAVTKEALFARDASGVYGYHENGRSYINAAAVSPEMAPAIVLHEIGVHAGMETMIGTEAWRAVLAEVERRAKSGDFDDHDFFRAYKTAWNRSSANHVWEETLAWGVTHFEELVEGSSFRGLIVRVIASVRAWLWKEFPALRDNINLTMADYHALAVGALRREAMAPIERTAPMGDDPLRTPIAEQQLADANRLEEIADMLKDCAP